MHPISDKELDKLFKNRFAEAEFQPSADVWAKISGKMDGKVKAKRSFPVFWMAAASVVVVLAAGLWLYRPVEVIRLHGSEQKMADIPISDLGTGAPVLDPHQPAISGIDFSKLASEKQSRKVETVLVAETDNQVPEFSRPEAVAVNNSRRVVSDFAQPKKEIKVPRYTGDQSQLDVTQPDMIASAEPVMEQSAIEQENSSPKRIRSVGSLVNFVISKVDRRDDKIIEFKDGEEGSEISGINLGLIKLKSRNR